MDGLELGKVTVLRRQISPTATGVDITVRTAKGTAKFFAPSWDMVMGHKSGVLTDAQYATQYRARMDAVPPSAWQWLLDVAREEFDGAIPLMCYCRSDVMCHTHLVAIYAATKFPDVFEAQTDPPECITPLLPIISWGWRVPS